KYAHVVNRLFNTGILNSFSFEFTDKFRSAFLQKYKTASSFINDYKISDTEISSLNAYLGGKKVKVTVKGSENGLSQILKALIGRNLFDKDAYYPILNKNDNCILKAMEVLKEKKV